MVFSNGWYEDGDHSIYVIRHLGGQVLYVGMSRDNIWNRWFYGCHAHIITNYYGEWFPGSSIGRYIIGNLPEANDYTVELWDVDECVDFCQDYIQNSPYKNVKRWDVDKAEIVMIKKLSPALNVMHNTP
jgi:hypothetical protein